MSKIYEETSRFLVECMGKPCDYYSECRYPPVYCNSHYCFDGTDMIEVKEFIKGRKSTPTEFSFYSMCRRDDDILSKKWNNRKLETFIKLLEKTCADVAFDFGSMRDELVSMELWEESDG